MWTRADLKDRAKQNLTDSYRKALLVSLIVFFLTSGIDFVYQLDNMNRAVNGAGFLTLRQGLWLSAGSLLFSVFVGNLLRVGESRFFLENREGRADLRSLTFGFGPDYKNLAAAQFTTDLLILLWSLLFIIPGIVAQYRYCMVPYLLSENPKMNGKYAREISSWMTRDQKWEIFLLDLSFLGWYLLGFFCLVAGAFFVLPYPRAARAELYTALKARDDPARQNAEQAGGSLRQ